MTFFTQQDRANLISKVILTLIFLIALSVSAFAQTIKSYLPDAQSEMPLIGATVEMLTIYQTSFSQTFTIGFSF